MNFELTISGLCLVALKSPKVDDLEPTKPLGIEVYCPQAANHRTVLTYDPEHAVANFEPELVVDENGKRFASVDLGGQVWSVSFKDGPADYTADWGKPTDEIPKPGEEAWLNWVPKLGDINLKDFEPAAAGQLPKHTATRLVLARGHLQAADIVKKKGKSEYAKWAFPAIGVKRALANQLFYVAKGIKDLEIKTTVGRRIYSERTTVRMALSNDLTVVPENYNDPHDKLHHLGHLKGMDGIAGDFKVPEAYEVKQTAKPICNSVLVVHI